MNGLVIVLIGLGTLVLVLGLYALSAVILMWAWNLIMPLLFHVVLLNFWQALAVVFLLSFVKQIVTITITHEK